MAEIVAVSAKEDAEWALHMARQIDLLYWRVFALSKIPDAMEEALEAAAQMDHPYWRSKAISRLVGKLALKDTDRAYSIAEKIPELLWRYEGIARIIAVQYLSNPEKASEAADRIPVLYSRSLAWYMAGCKLIKIDFQGTLALAHRIEHPYWQQKMQAKIALQQSKIYLHGSLDSARRLIHPYQQAKTLAKIAVEIFAEGPSAPPFIDFYPV
jgi:hypothetical protein